MARCKTCGKQIQWLRLGSGKWNPVDPGRIPYEPDEDGKLTLITMDGDVVRGNLDIMSHKYGYQSHFATCPDADQHRRRSNETD